MSKRCYILGSCLFIAGSLYLLATAPSPASMVYIFGSVMFLVGTLSAK